LPSKAKRGSEIGRTNVLVLDLRLFQSLSSCPSKYYCRY
jgi:hypothetical protein